MTDSGTESNSRQRVTATTAQWNWLSLAAGLLGLSALVLPVVRIGLLEFTETSRTIWGVADLLEQVAFLELGNPQLIEFGTIPTGLGVDYSIHVGERFVEEREQTESLDSALTATITGTGGALLGSAATTAAGFGVVSLASPLQRFGIVTAMSIILAFISCLTVLPCLLVIRERVLARRSQ